MLEKIREGSQGPVAKVILGAVILSFALAGIGSYLGQTTEQPVAEVNGIKISQTEFSRALQNERSRLEQQFGEYFTQIAADPTYMAQIRQGVIDRLVQQELQSQLATELGLRVSDESIRQTILELPYFKIGDQFNNDRYLQVIRQMNFQPDSFREYLRDDMTRSQLVSAVAGTDFALQNELKSAIALQQQTRSIDYLVIDKQAMQANVDVTDQEVADYYELNAGQFLSPELISVNYIELDADDIDVASVSEDDVKAYYEQSKAQYIEPEKRRVSHILIDNSEDDDAAKAKAESLLAQLNAGADFAQLAESSSDDIVSAEMGGDLEWIERDVMEPAFEDAAFALQNKGDYSDVVASEFGYHIIKLTDIQSQQVKPYDAVKADLRAELEQAEKVDAFYEKQTEMGALAFEISDRLDDAAEVAGVEVQSTPLLALSALPEPLNNPAVITALSSVELLEDKVNSEVIELGNEHVIVVRVNEHQPAATKALSEVSEQIKTRLVNEKASDLAKEKARTLFAQIKDGKSLNDVAAEQSLSVRQESQLTRESFAVSPAIVTQVFKMAHPRDGAVYDVVNLNNGDAAIVALNSVTDALVSDSIEPQMKQNITMAQAQKNYTVFIESLKQQAELNVPKAAQPAE
ncbi:MAG: peptidyl-prolyl cis-trans isomerase D [Pseudoalteromonas tetraodonis]|jgi:peptidyl-prolyl cis-trans isomerase D|uniref:Periplasmic chaperone PpiD n=2 Tax=Pseudoalteromonas tetraodonis TaxID=43659 RepID=A0AA37S0F9_9GAMM|nr:MULTISPECIES: peptidylprolyl isomerase [Pseudoalteromonas]ATD03739.1 peptidyl-prolyl cis-trans isomerase D [Pseudoalteromonas tetraodonis]KYL35853.1 peptidylprolyl isomerase [Pseudoalteromonas spiralis]MDN3395362.1 peptidylprolyl isomerase [Pseudoalteromonas sp. APC 3215]MDN3402125.1 peptidylprolyl isomerase [Pseudoalteromonas sp. APC 3213]MDN3406115.1 peptidylprolyl isomerase [Pseudoalteromonas sp. APC 3218]|tara:strand:+ start:6587 stop:8488 length:1902 start_codon:yes stop_codon:yes gene_type:complete